MPFEQYGQRLEPVPEQSKISVALQPAESIKAEESKGGNWKHYILEPRLQIKRRKDFRRTFWKIDV